MRVTRSNYSCNYSIPARTANTHHTQEHKPPRGQKISLAKRQITFGTHIVCRFGMKILAKVSLVSACILVVIVLVLVLPLYAKPRGQTEEIGEIFALQKSVYLDGLFSGSYYSTSAPIWGAHLGSAYLESGWCAHTQNYSSNESSNSSVDIESDEDSG
jgi:hypothetical protein